MEFSLPQSSPRSRLLLLAATGSCLSLGACSTLAKGTSQQVALNTTGAPTANCHLTGGDNVNLTVATPGSVHLPKSRKNIDVTCNAAGLPPVTKIMKSSYSDLSIIEPPFGYPIDALSGAMWNYPKTFTVPLGNPPDTATPASPNQQGAPVND